MRFNDLLLQLFSLKGRTAVVTGAAAGIGRGVAELFVTAGAKVAMAGSTAHTLAVTAAEIRQAADGHADVIDVATDVSQEDQVRRLFDTAESTFGTVDVLVNCAGVFPIIPFEELTTQTWDRVHAVNTRGAYLCMREAVKRMKRAGHGGAIVNVSSVASQAVAVLGQAQYSSSKAGVNMLTKAVALEFAASRIRVNAVLPGSIDTPGVRSNMARLEADPRLAAGPSLQPGRVPLGFMGQPLDVAAACLYLASPAANYVTGQLLAVDGGFLIS
jgi:NAD(P)-dependent dehydrogenase (short-subunit alcohol dehydrogenase family)